MKIYRCMHDIEAMCNEHGRQLLLIWFINYLPLTKFNIVNPVWAISTFIITSCCTCHNYISNLFLNGILAGTSMSYGHFSSLILISRKTTGRLKPDLLARNLTLNSDLYTNYWEA